LASGKPPGGLENESFDIPEGNEPLRFRNVSGGALASGKPPGGLESESFDIPETGV